MTNESEIHGSGQDGLGGDGVSTLSSAGAARRDAMLPQLQGAVVREGARRRARRVAIRRAGAFSLVVAIGVSIIISRPAPINESPFVGNDLKAPTIDFPKAPTIDPPTRIVRVKSKPGALERYAYVPRVDPAEYIVDDRTFVAALASIGRPTGLVRRGDRVMLTNFTPDPIRVPAPDKQDGASEPGTPAQH